MIKYCVSICSEDISSAIQKINQVYDRTDLIEIRIDKFRKFDLNALRKFDLKKMILTLRNRSNGGFFSGSEKERINLLKTFLDFGFGFMDIEYDIPKNDLKWFLCNRTNTKIILSYHNFVETPGNLEKICAKLISHNPDLIKVISHSNSINDNKLIFDLIDKYKNIVKLVMHSMGECGEISRILGGLRGNAFTFTSFGDEATAPGQISLEKLSDTYNLSRLKRDFKVYGLFGNPVKHSFGYIIHNFAFDKNKNNSIYLNFLSDDAGSFIENYRDLFTGLSITIPFKKSIMPFLDEIDSDAEIIGAVNTVVKKKGKLIGYNTDYTGFIESLKRYITPRNKRIVILGSGGSARAVVVSLLNKKNEITILNRNIENAKKLAIEFSCGYGDLSEFKNHAPQVLVNCTPSGMYPNINESPVALNKLRNCVVYDLIYNPYHTKLLVDACRNGNTIVSGFEMFLRQAQEQYKLFTGENFSYLKYRNYFLKKLSII